MRKVRKVLAVVGLLGCGLLSSCGEQPIPGPTGPTGPKGDTGENGIGIVDVYLSKTEGDEHTYTIVFTDGTTTDFTVTDGRDGHDGRNGADGEDGTDGDDGLSAFEIFKKYHPEYTGTEEDWIEDLITGGAEVFTVTFDPNGGTLDPDEKSAEVRYARAVEDLPIPYKAGKQFLGWYTGWSPSDVEVKANTPIYSDMNLVAKWDTYDVTFTDWTGSVYDQVEVPAGQTYSEPRKEPTRPTDSDHSYAFSGWDRDSKLPVNSDLVVNPTWTTLDPIHTVEFGSYPQSVVSDPLVIAQLVVQSGATSDGRVLTVDTDSDGMEERYLVKDLDYTFQADDGTTMEPGYHYFRFEPIVWRVIAVTSNSYYLLSDQVLDTYRFSVDEYDLESPITHDDVSIANDFGKSTLREWFTEEFLDAAFSAEDQEKLITTEVTNCKEDDPYQYKVSQDKVFIPSSQELEEYGLTEATDWRNGTSRVGHTTDYARANSEDIKYLSFDPNTYGDCDWWLRSGVQSITDETQYQVEYVSMDGSLNDQICSSYKGIRPMIQLTMDYK